MTKAESAPAGRRSRLPVALILVAALSAASILADTTVDATQARQALGLTRGSIVDVRRIPLASVTQRNGAAYMIYRDPGLTPALGRRGARGRWDGLELTYDDVLRVHPTEPPWRALASHVMGRVEHGDTVQLTIDDRLQRVAEHALGNHAGAIVALDPATGAIRALVGGPKGGADDRAINRLYAPGSIFKIVTLSAALDSGRYRLNDVFSGSDVFGPSPYFDNLAYPSNITRTDLSAITLKQALAFSDNFTYAHVGVSLGQALWSSYARRFGIGRRLSFPFPVSVSHVLDDNSRPSTAELARSSFGAADDQVTVLQMAMITAAVANRGVLMAPRLVDRVTRPDGSALVKYPPRILARVMAPRSAREVGRAMAFVVNHGSGLYAQIPGVQVCGKTGTADSGAAIPHAWFIAFAPEKHPVLAVAVLREFSGEGFRYAAPLSRRVLIAALQEKGYGVH